MTNRVLVTGATGYVGRHVAARLTSAGFAVRALARTGSDTSVIARHTTDVHRGTITNRESLRGACKDCFAVVHLVGIINEAEDTFERIHVEGTWNIINEATDSGVCRFIYLSGLGSRWDAASKYHRTKFQAEELVRRFTKEGYNFPASVIFGPEDEFLNLFVKFARNIINPKYPPWPIMPLLGGGKSVLQPIWVEDVAEVLTRACDRAFPEKLPPGTYHLGGPEVLTVREIMQIACDAAGRKRVFVPVPMFAARLIATVMEKVSSKPLLTRDQLIMLGEDGTAKNNKTREILGREPRSIRDYAEKQFTTP
ncbi:MAG TPA: NAD-dependent epimerase/dehydratase family protein [Planctomycetota bacterium]|nr:NAD-dependent epimerase/dehydratase family protein [Planctomycetota bacterium]